MEPPHPKDLLEGTITFEPLENTRKVWTLDAYLDGVYAGYITAAFTGGTATLTNYRSEFPKNGVGSALLDEFAKEAADRGCKTIQARITTEESRRLLFRKFGTPATLPGKILTCWSL